jgi:hypothetical protein
MKTSFNGTQFRASADELVLMSCTQGCASRAHLPHLDKPVSFAAVQLSLTCLRITTVSLQQKLGTASQG